MDLLELTIRIPLGLQIEAGLRSTLKLSIPALNLDGNGLEAEERFWANVAEVESGCWEWQASKFWNGYGQVTINGKNRSTHRVSYEFTYGPIPKGLLVRHSCDNRACVNPNHLSLGTHKDNTQDMIARGRSTLRAVIKGTRRGAYKTHCKNGHLLNEDNRRRNGGCRTCHIERERARRNTA